MNVVTKVFGIILLAVVCKTAIAQQTDPVWVTSPENTGEDIPTIGSSLFDKLFSTEANGEIRYDIPFPFSALLKKLQNMIINDEGTKVPHTLIPIGRSLQKAAAAPYYFDFPRHIISANGESKGSDIQDQMVLQNRFFIAYQEKAHQMEVISYNEEMGRFEFQRVDDYKSNQVPSVSYASRATCIACHQNSGPIFSESPWDETNFNPDIARALSKAQPERYPGFLDAVSFDAVEIDQATDYANYLDIVQLFWRQGCGSRLDMASTQCRGAFLKAIIQYRLSADLAFDKKSDSFSKNLMQQVSRQWQLRWPGGLLTHTADIPDLDPFKNEAEDASFDPLTTRQPAGHWKIPGTLLLDDIINRLSSFLLSADIQTIDRRLNSYSNASENNKLFQCPIDLMGKSELWNKAILQCGTAADYQRLFLNLDIQRNQQNISSAIIKDIRIPDSAIIWGAIFKQPRFREFDSKQIITTGLGNVFHDTSARFSNGDRLKMISMSWPETPLVDGKATVDALISLNITLDFNRVERAIDKLVTDTLSGKTDALSPLPFRRSVVMQGLLKYL